MLLDDYLNNIKGLLDNIDFVVNQSLTIDKRAQQQAHIFGYLIFIDESELQFESLLMLPKAVLINSLTVITYRIKIIIYYSVMIMPNTNPL